MRSRSSVSRRPNLLEKLGVERPGDIVSFADEAGTNAQTVVYLVHDESEVVAAFALPLAAGVLAPIGVLLSPAVGAVVVSLTTIIVAINARRLRGVDLA